LLVTVISVAVMALMVSRVRCGGADWTKEMPPRRVRPRALAVLLV
jgi:hypothetical protein